MEYETLKSSINKITLTKEDIYKKIQEKEEERYGEEIFIF